MTRPVRLAGRRAQARIPVAMNVPQTMPIDRDAEGRRLIDRQLSEARHEQERGGHYRQEAEVAVGRAGHRRGHTPVTVRQRTRPSCHAARPVSTKTARARAEPVACSGQTLTRTRVCPPAIGGTSPMIPTPSGPTLQQSNRPPPGGREGSRSHERTGHHDHRNLPSRRACLVDGCSCKDARIISHRRVAYFASQAIGERRDRQQDRPGRRRLAPAAPTSTSISNPRKEPHDDRSATSSSTASRPTARREIAARRDATELNSAKSETALRTARSANKLRRLLLAI